MGHAGIGLGLPGRWLGFLLLVGVCASFSPAQQAPNAHVPSAPRLLLLPPTIVAGAPATLAVLDSQGRLLPDIHVELSDGQKATTDATGRAIFRGPDTPGTLVARTAGKEITASATVVNSEASAQHGSTEAAQGGASVLSYPHAVAIHDRFTLEGAGFRGAADSNQVYLNDDPCLVVASSPTSLVVLPGQHVPVGDITLHVTVGSTDAGQFPVSAVLLEFTGPEEAVNAGSAGKLILHAHGTAEPLLVEIRNGSPGVIQLSKGNVQRLKTSGGEENIASLEVKFVTGGNYTVSARLVSADTVAPNLDSARAKSLPARN